MPEYPPGPSLGASLRSIRSSQKTAGVPFSANFLVQKVFPVPDMPSSANRMGFPSLGSLRITEFPIIACPRQGSNSLYSNGSLKNSVLTWNLCWRTAGGPYAPLVDFELAC